MTIKMVMLPKPESGMKRPKPTTPKNDAFAMVAILRCLYGSEMVRLGVVIRKCETPTTNISQENGHGILMITCQFVAYN